MNTSYYAYRGYISSPVAISRMIPSYYRGRRMIQLAPPTALVRAAKSGSLEKAEYVEWYDREVLKPLNPRRTYDYICSTFGEDCVLLCYEAPGVFCHRRLVAEWFESTIGVVVAELDAIK